VGEGAEQAAALHGGFAPHASVTQPIKLVGRLQPNAPDAHRARCAPREVRIGSTAGAVLPQFRLKPTLQIASAILSIIAVWTLSLPGEERALHHAVQEAAQAISLVLAHDAINHFAVGELDAGTGGVGGEIADEGAGDLLFLIQ
jgi:hypothetical protein